MTSSSRRGRILHRADAAVDGGRWTVWAVGAWGEREFAAAAADLADSCAWSTFEDLESAIASLPSRGAPQTLLLAQPRPGMHEQEEIDKLIAAAPLAEVVVVAGTWCEGELRTGRPLRGVQRVYWHQLGDWRRRRCQAGAATSGPHWALDVRRAGPGDLASADAEALGDAIVAIDARDYSVFETLAEGLRPVVRECVWTPRGRGELGGASLGIWDGGQLDEGELAALVEFCAKLGQDGGAVLALVDFPRAEHLRLAAEAGACGVLGKPYWVGEAVHRLGEAAALSRERRGGVGVTRRA